ncbi:response regulator [Notoacmeibacter ruber]|uniref:Response regulator n=2 Tax=Notoacmeibacter ruber TaxID=2670375 RepID=A0A3L7JLE2_9HYPH|nr:response regulator [Notoacmeibacter ruber]RLQ89342.1 response regulator [Notoacmeibacter ruber]
MRILYVDDDADIREIAEMSLQLDPELDVKCSDNGKDALEIAREWKPDLILLDVMMPNMDGPTVLSHLREETETTHIPVVFMTARTQRHEVEQFIALGARGVIAKPFNPMSLASEARGYLGDDAASVDRPTRFPGS